MMSEQWKSMHFMDCIEKVKTSSKIQKKRYLSEGKYPIVSQDSSIISGYWNNSDDLFIVENSVVVFGDHTCALKFVDFDFVVGADGVKILKPKDFLDTKFFFYQLLSFNLQSTGYARHFRKLKEQMISIPPLDEQERIVSILDEALENYNHSIITTGKMIDDLKKLFQSTLENCFKEMNEKWNSESLWSLATVETGKWDANHSTEDGEYKFFTCARQPLACHTSRFRGECIITPGNGANVGDVLYYEGEFDAYQRTYVLSDIKLFPRFLFFHMLTFWKKINESKQYGSATNFIKQGNFKDYIVEFPEDYSEQIIIAEKLNQFQSNMNELEIVYRQKITSLHQLKQSILQEAFSGKLTGGITA